MKRISFPLIALILSCFLFSSCSKLSSSVPAGKTETAGQETVSSGISYPLSITDQTGRTVTIEKEPQRIVSGYYISTSILIALGLKDKIVGIESKADKRPIYRLSAPELISLPDVGTAKQFDIEKCASLEPDLVILPAKLKNSVQALEDLGIKVLFVDPENEEKLNEAILLTGKAANREERAGELIGLISSVSKEISEKTASLEKKRVCITGNSDPLSVATGKMYQSYLIETAGGKNVADSIEDSNWADVSYEQLLSWDPEVIILAGEAAYSIDDILNDSNLKECTAVKEKAVYQIPSAAESIDSPVPAGIYGALWAASKLHPEEISEKDFIEAITGFYKTYYGFEYEKK